MRGRWVTCSCTSSVLDLENSRWADLAIVVRRAQRGDREAFGALVEQFQPTVYAIALRRLGNPSDALELTQEVFLHVLAAHRPAPRAREVRGLAAAGRRAHGDQPRDSPGGPGECRDRRARGGLRGGRRAARSVDQPRASRAASGRARAGSSRWIARPWMPSTSAATR